jgi:hypothetical protein
MRCDVDFGRRRSDPRPFRRRKHIDPRNARNVDLSGSSTGDNDRRGCAVIDYLAQPTRRYRWVDRNESGSPAQHAVRRGNEFGAASANQKHAVFGADANFAQPVREMRARGSEFRKGQDDPLVSDRRIGAARLGNFSNPCGN